MMFHLKASIADTHDEQILSCTPSLNTWWWYEHQIKVTHVHHYRASGRKMEKFSVSVNIAAKSGVTFILTYEELLERKLGQYEILIRVRPQQPVQEFQVEHNLLLYFSY